MQISHMGNYYENGEKLKLKSHFNIVHQHSPA